MRQSFLVLIRVVRQPRQVIRLGQLRPIAGSSLDDLSRDEYRASRRVILCDNATPSAQVGELIQVTCRSSRPLSWSLAATSPPRLVPITADPLGISRLRRCSREASAVTSGSPCRSAGRTNRVRGNLPRNNSSSWRTEPPGPPPQCHGRSKLQIVWVAEDLVDGTALNHGHEPGALP